MTNSRRVGWLDRRVQALILAALVAAVALVGYLASSVAQDLYSGAPASIPVSTIAASCQSEAGAAACDATVVRLNAGRFYVRTRRPASSMTVTIDDATAIANSRVLLLRSQSPGRLVVGSDAGLEASDAFTVDVTPDVRTVIHVPERVRARIRMTFVATASSKPIVINELGFFGTETGLLRSSRQPWSRIAGQRFYGTYVVLLTLMICASVVITALLWPAVLHPSGPWLVAMLCVFICILEVATNFSPYWKYDLRSFYAAETIESGTDGNLTGGLYVGARLFEGRGLTVPVNNVQWHRMPGYGLFCGLAASIGRTTDVVEVAMIVIILQAVLYGASVGVFVAVAPRIFPVWLSYLLGVLIMLLPKQLHYTQVDSIIAPISVLVLATLIVCLTETGDGPPRLRTFLLVNAAFALWFVMRNDVLPGWMIVSTVLARHRLRYLAIPAVLAATLALSWGLYKRPYRHEFDPMPTNTGEVLFLSLCEVPGSFPYPCVDDGYFGWIRGVSHAEHTSQKANDVAIAEVLRYWATYPVHFGFMVWTKFTRCIHEEFWSGIYTRFNKVYGILGHYSAAVYLLAAVLMSFVVNHERRRSFLLGWALFFNMPIFFVVYASNGRFYPPAGVSLLAAAVPLLFEPGFYRQMARHSNRVAVVVACVATYVVVANRVQDWVMAHNAIHYWAPLLDPRSSTLGVLP